MAVHYQLSGSTAVEISASVEAGVRDGLLSPGAPLPTVRALAAELGVSPATVTRAYHELRQRGVVTTAGRNGTRVRPRPAVVPPRSTLVPAPAAGTLDLSSGSPDPRLLPPLGPALAALASAGPPTGYAATQVLPELTEVARRRLAHDGVPAESLTLACGALDAIERLLGAHLLPGDTVAVEDPGWANAYDLLAAARLRAHPVAVDDEGPTVDGVRAALAAGARALIVTNRAQNPTGAALSAERADLLRPVLARSPDLLLIEDDHAAELAAVALHTLARATRHWAFVRSTSKPFGPDLRLAVVAGDPTTVARVAGRMRLGAGWVSTVLQRLVLALWRDPDTSRLIDVARAEYRHRRESLIAALAARDVPARGRSGLNVWVPVPDETRAVTSLRDAGWSVAPGAPYRLASGPAIRITVSLLDDGVDELAAAVAHAVRAPGRSGFTA